MVGEHYYASSEIVPNFLIETGKEADTIDQIIAYEHCSLWKKI